MRNHVLTLRVLCFRLALLWCVFVRPALGQNPFPGPPSPPVTTNQIIMPVFTVNPVPVPSATTALVGNPGPRTLYYWLQANYQVGQSSVSGPYVVTNAPNTLSGSNYVQVAPVYPLGAASVTLLRTSTNLAPSGACNCAVVVAQASGVVNDQSEALTNYTVSPVDLNGKQLTLANEVQSSGATHLILRQGGTFVSDLSVPGGGSATPGGLITSLQYNLDGTHFGGFNDGTATQVLHGGRVFGAVTAADTDGSLIEALPVVGQSVYQPPDGSGVPTDLCVNHLDGAVTVCPSLWAAPASAPDLTGGVAGTISWTTFCPPGLSQNDHPVYISGGTGTAEAPLITTFTGTWGGSCSITLTPANSHSGYSVATATAGIKEASEYAKIVLTSPSVANARGKVTVPPSNSYVINGTLQIEADGQTVDFQSSTLQCNVVPCVKVGNSTNSYKNNALRNLFLQPIAALAGFALVIAGNNTRLENIHPRNPPTTDSQYFSSSGATVGGFIENLNDQNLAIDNASTNGGASAFKCTDDNNCSVQYYDPGPFGTNAGILNIYNTNFSAGCRADGILNLAANTLNLHSTQIQGYPRFGIISTIGTVNPAASLVDPYFEIGSCTNPMGLGTMGVLVRGQGGLQTTGLAGGPASKLPAFMSAGGTTYLIWIVGHHSTLGYSTRLLAGTCQSPGTGACTIKWPQFADASATFDVLATVGALGTTTVSPSGTGNYAIATGLPAGSVCTSGNLTGTCQTTWDTSVAFSSYTVQDAQFCPLLSFWPASVALACSSDTTSLSATARWFPERLPFKNSGEAGLVAAAGSGTPSVFVPINTGDSAYSSPAWVVSPTGASSNNPESFRIQILDSATGQKGPLIFSGSPRATTIAASHLVTLFDSNRQKTGASPGQTPTYDPNDAWLGIDASCTYSSPTCGFALGFPTGGSFSTYIGNVGDGTNWLERLTASLKEFKTNVQLDANLEVDGTTHLIGNVQIDGTLTVGGGTALWTQGNGSPEGVITAPVGSLYSRLNGGANTSLYVKESGTGNTGWVAK